MSTITVQLGIFQDLPRDTRPPETPTWNLWHGCTKVSAGCAHCYMYRRDESVGRDPSKVEKTREFDLPVRILRSGPYRGLYAVPAGSLVYTCFSSDFFHPAADEWRQDAWDMIRTRSDCGFFMITKRHERIASCLPPDWGDGWDHVTVAVTCENADAADKRLPVDLALPLRHSSVMIEPMLSPVDLGPWFRDYPGAVEAVSAGGESGPDARPCDFAWVTRVRDCCSEYGVAFSYHQTGARLIKDGKDYIIPRRLQHSQAKKAGLDIPGAADLSAIPGE